MIQTDKLEKKKATRRTGKVFSGKMCDVIDCRVIMETNVGSLNFQVEEQKKNKEVKITDSKFCLQRDDTVPQEE